MNVIVNDDELREVLMWLKRLEKNLILNSRGREADGVRKCVDNMATALARAEVKHEQSI